ncbi:P-loop containing nucleoside triphosphate hydrolase protein [Aspergillus venezuelensis]
MDQYLLDNVQRYQTLVGRFKPLVANEPPRQPSPNPNLLVATRIRPLLESETKSGQVPGIFPRPGQDGVIDVHELRKAVHGLPTLNSFCFRSDQTFHPHQPTEIIYDELVKSLMPCALEGRVGTLFVSGHAGSGRKYTVRGLERLIARSLFEAVQPMQQVHISMLELAGNSTYDLLNSRASLQMFEGASGQFQLEGVVEDHVSDPHALSHSFAKASETMKSNGPSNSHVVYRIQIKDNSRAGPGGSLYMVSLASSEGEWDTADPATDRVKEGRETGLSLLTLKECIRTVAQIDVDSTAGDKGKQPHVPFRQSVLTKVVKHLFEPGSNTSCKTIFLACVNPSFLDVEAAKSTLRYADMLRAPNLKAGDYDPAVPSTWSNKDVKNYIKLQSKYLPVTAYDLAPTETGDELLHLSVDEFVRRCLLSPDVTEEQARAFYAKLWALHVRSRRKSNSERKPDIDLPVDNGVSLTSMEPDNERAKLFFKERIRPGMAVRWNAPWDSLKQSPARNLALILSPQEDGNCRCAMVLPGASENVYEVHIWRQLVINIGDMEAEVVLEYDRATRYYRPASR